MSGKKAKNLRKAQGGASGPETRPSRSTKLPAAPTDRTLDYAKCRDELQGIEPGEVVLAIETTNAWQTVMVPLLDAIEER
jgi:hypothetical protein